jgi:hypothetical protein
MNPDSEYRKLQTQKIKHSCINEAIDSDKRKLQIQKIKGKALDIK